MSTTITINDDLFGPVTIPAGRNYQAQREGACIDQVIETAVTPTLPIGVRLLLKTDGRIEHWDTFYRASSYYAHHPEGFEPRSEPTQPQRVAIAKWWANVERPLGLKTGVSGPLMAWAFGGMSADEIAALAGVKTPALTD